MSSKRNLITAACIFIFGILLVLYLLTANNFSQFPENTDFYKFYKSARFFAEGKSIYTPVPFKPPDDYLGRLSEKAKATMKTSHPNLNSPFHTLFILPLGTLPFHIAFWLWSIFSLCLSLMAVGLIAYTQPFRDYEMLKSGFINQNKMVHTSISTIIKTGGNLGDNRIFSDKGLLDTQAIYVLILWIIILCYFPTWVSIVSGQFGLFLLGSIVLIWLSARKEKYQLAGIILGIALSVKIFLGLFLIFFAMQRRWRVLFWAVSIFIFCNIISLITFGLSTYKQYLELLARSHLYINASWNASFIAFFTRIFGGAENIPWIKLPLLAYCLAYSLSFLLTLLLIRTAWPQPRELSPLVRFDIGYALTIVAMLLISPFGWMYYFPALIIPLLVIWHISSVLKAGNLYKSLLTGAWILSCIPTQLINSEETAINQPIVWFITSGYYFYALIIFCSLLLVISHRLSKESKGDDLKQFNSLGNR
jgi:hypothetical protein